MRTVTQLVGVSVAVLSAAALAACGGPATTPTSGVRMIPLTATDDSCQVAATELTSGVNTFAVRNKGRQVTEVYVYAAGDKVVAERENIGPGTRITLTVELAPGRYEIACKPGMVGRGIRQAVTVTGTRSATADPRAVKAIADYRAYVSQQVADTLARAKELAAAVKAGDLAAARSRYAPSRVGWERIEPVAESFGDIDPKVDIREADLEQGQEFTGWHRLEKALWQQDAVTAEDRRYADRLVSDLAELSRRIPAAQITATSMANGAKELLDEVATTKVTGEEETFSHTDLVDFAANVEGARQVFTLLKPIVRDKDPALADTIDQGFDDVLALLARYRSGTGYVSYDTVRPQQRKELSDAVNALAEPLSRLAATVAG